MVSSLMRLKCVRLGAEGDVPGSERRQRAIGFVTPCMVQSPWATKPVKVFSMVVL
jgi:hypothetical protein